MTVISFPDNVKEINSLSEQILMTYPLSSSPNLSD